MRQGEEGQPRSEEFHHLVVEVSTLVLQNNDYAVAETPHDIIDKTASCNGPVYSLFKKIDDRWKTVGDGFCESCQIRVSFPLHPSRIHQFVITKARQTKNRNPIFQKQKK